jgi:adenine-specific DNA-methyltransferase
MQIVMKNNIEFHIKTPKTEGIKYAGSKLKLIPHIVNLINDLEVKNILDGFSGTTRVSQAFSKLGYNVTSNDISVWSEVFGKAYLLNTRKPEYYVHLIEHLNSIKGYEGWFSYNYGGKVD